MNVFLRRAESIDAYGLSIDVTLHAARWVGRVWRYVEVECGGFLIQSCSDFGSHDCQGHVHEVDRHAPFGEDPSETIAVYCFFEFSKLGIVISCVVVVQWDPAANAIVNKSIVEWEVSLVCRQVLFFINTLAGGFPIDVPEI